jgi:hypothetical protein
MVADRTGAAPTAREREETDPAFPAPHYPSCKGILYVRGMDGPFVLIEDKGAGGDALLFEHPAASSSPQSTFTRISGRDS